MKIALGSDHRGFDAMRTLRNYLDARGHETLVRGDCTGEPCDYPDQAYAIARAVADGEARFGFLLCGSGNGVCMAANKVPGVRAAIGWDEASAAMSRRHNDANVLCLSADHTNSEQIEKIVDAFLDARFEGGRHERRVKKMKAIERGEDPSEIDHVSNQA